MKTLKLKIEVTEEDFKRGKAVDCSKCPLALATIRAAQEAGVKAIATVRFSEIRLDVINGDEYRAVLPGIFGDFIDFFDNWKDFNRDFASSKFMTPMFKPFSRVVTFVKS